MPHEPESRHAKRGDDWQLTPETRVLIHDQVRMSSHRKRAAHLQRRRASSSTELFSSRTWPAGTQRPLPSDPLVGKPSQAPSSGFMIGVSWPRLAIPDQTPPFPRSGTDNRQVGIRPEVYA